MANNPKYEFNWNRSWKHLLEPSNPFSSEELVSRGCIPEELRGWNGAMIPLCSSSPLTFYPATPTHQTCFSDKLHRQEAAIIRPSVDFWKWLVESPGSIKGWQMRGGLFLKPAQLAALVGAECCHAISNGQIELKSLSLWAGSSGTRTPLHVDLVHGIIFQISGRKRWFLSTERDVETAVVGGRVPRSVIEEGNTDNFVREGSQEQVFGGGSERLVDGQVIVLEEGDAMLLPAGLYHDVEADSHSLSITIRFELPSPCSATQCCRPRGHWGSHVVEPEPQADHQTEPETESETAPEPEPHTEGVTQRSLFHRWRSAVEFKGGAQDERPSHEPTDLTVRSGFDKWRNMFKEEANNQEIREPITTGRPEATMEIDEPKNTFDLDWD